MGGGGAPAVTAAVQVTANPDPLRAHTSPQIALNPETGELVIAEAEIRTAMTCSVHLSNDRGRSWSPGGNAVMEPYTNCGGAPSSSNVFTLAFGPDAVLYFAFTAHDPAFDSGPRGDRPRHVFVARSTDSGRTFETTMAYRAPGGSSDPRNGNIRPMVATDPSEAGRVYLSWMQPATTEKPEQALIAASTDGARTFAEPVNVADNRGAFQARPAVGPDGVVHAIIPTRGFANPRPPDPPVRPLNYRRSVDHGRTWSEPVEVDRGNAGFSFARKWALAVGPDPEILYVVWYGNSDPQAQRSPRGEPSSAEFADREIFLRVSRDKGDTWEPAKLVNDDAQQPNIQHYDPAVSVAPNGRLDIVWYDFRNSPTPEQEGAGGNDGGAHDVYYTFSTDQGRSLAPNIRITDRIIDRTIGVWSNNVHSHGHIGLASANDAAYVTWQDTRNGDPLQQAEDVYFASVRFGAEADDSGEDVPSWMLIGAGVAAGMGAAMLLALAVRRRSSDAPLSSEAELG